MDITRYSFIGSFFVGIKISVHYKLSLYFLYRKAYLEETQRLCLESKGTTVVFQAYVIDFIYTVTKEEK